LTRLVGDMTRQSCLTSTADVVVVVVVVGWWRGRTRRGWSGNV